MQSSSLTKNTFLFLRHFDFPDFSRDDPYTAEQHSEDGKGRQGVAGIIISLSSIEPLLGQQLRWRKTGWPQVQSYSESQGTSHSLCGNALPFRSSFLMVHGSSQVTERTRSTKSARTQVYWGQDVWLQCTENHWRTYASNAWRYSQENLRESLVVCRCEFPSTKMSVFVVLTATCSCQNSLLSGVVPLPLPFFLFCYVGPVQSCPSSSYSSGTGCL